MEPKRHGSPIFYAMLEEMADLHDRKSHDYASNENPYGNYHFAGKLACLFSHCEQDAGFIGRLGEKFYRLANLEKSSKTPSNESIDDTERDICVITVLWMADRRNRRWSTRENQATSAKDSESQESACEIIRLAETLNNKDLMQMFEYLHQVHQHRLKTTGQNKSESPSQT